MTGLLFGVGAVFLMSPRMTSYWKSGSMRWTEWACVFGAGTVGYTAARWVSINSLGNANAYHNHWMAYGFVKNCNRWEGR